MESGNLLKKYNKILSFAAILILAILCRIFPHPPNVAPIGGLALFSGKNIDSKFAYIVPILVMILSDMFLGLHSVILFVYFAFLIYVFIGRRISRVNNFSHIMIAVFTSSLLFFLITNFGVWFVSGLYPRTFDGLVAAYYMALPFYRNTIIGDLIYSFVFIYGYFFIMQTLRSFSKNTSS